MEVPSMTGIQGITLVLFTLKEGLIAQERFLQSAKESIALIEKILATCEVSDEKR